MDEKDINAFAVLLELFACAVNAASAQNKIRPLPSKPKGRTIVLGAGKAAASMAKAFEDAWPKDVEGLVITRYNHGLETKNIEVIEASHPVPDDKGLHAAKRVMSLAKSATKDDLVVFLGSGGASSLLVVPAVGITLADKQKLTSSLLKSGAPIDEINTVRRAMSAIKGGRLAKACEPASVVSYLISDVPGDDPAVIGSGPTLLAPDGITYQEVIEKYALNVDESVIQAMQNNKTAILLNSPIAHIIAKASDSLEAVAQKASAIGFRPVILGADIEGEAKDVARSMANQVRTLLKTKGTPTILLSGGETTVTVNSDNPGGRNQEFLLALALELDGEKGVFGIACDTDGIDGSTEHAGAMFNQNTLSEIKNKGLDPKKCLETNDAHSAFKACNLHVTTGPTRTNVNDFRAIVIVPTD